MSEHELMAACTEMGVNWDVVKDLAIKLGIDLLNFDWNSVGLSKLAALAALIKLIINKMSAPMMAGPGCDVDTGACCHESISHAAAIIVACLKCCGK